MRFTICAGARSLRQQVPLPVTEMLHWSVFHFSILESALLRLEYNINLRPDFGKNGSEFDTSAQMTVTTVRCGYD